MATNISDMGEFLLQRYKGVKWRQKILAMSSAQIQAIYFRTMAADAKKKAAKERLCGVQTRMNLEANKGNGS